MVRGARILPVVRGGTCTRIAFLRLFTFVEGNRSTPLYILRHFERSEKSWTRVTETIVETGFLAALEMTLVEGIRIAHILLPIIPLPQAMPTSL